MELIYDYEQEFKKYMRKTHVEQVCGGKWVPDYLREVKIDSFEKLKVQFDLVQKKECMFSRNQRLEIEKAYTVITG